MAFRFTQVAALLLLLQFVNISSVESKKNLPPWTPIDWRTLPLALPDDQIAVIYLVSPLLEADFGDWLEYLNLYHGAIAFTNLRTNESITINYDADDFFRNSLFPQIIHNTNGTRELKWINQGGNFIYQDINETYWTAAQEVVATISGDLYNNYIVSWNSRINETNPFYNMFSVTSKFGATPWLPSWDCFDFIWASFQVLHEWGAKFNPSLKLKRDFANIYSSIEPIDYTEKFNDDTDVREDIIDFFTFIQVSFDQLSFMEFFDTLYELGEGKFYVRFTNQYWQTKLHWPYFAVDYEVAALPGQQL